MAKLARRAIDGSNAMMSGIERSAIGLNDREGRISDGGGSLNPLRLVVRTIDGDGVNPISCCEGASYNKTLLHSAIFVSPESTLTMEGSDGKSRFKTAGKMRKACAECG